MNPLSNTQGPSFRRSSDLAAARSRRVSEPAMSSSASVTAQSSAAMPGIGSSMMPSQASDVQRYPLVMPPVSQLNRIPRRHSRADAPLSDRSTSWDPEYHNPDGSLRTVHRMPGFDQAYAQAMQARYIRHRERPAKDVELTVDEIFDSKEMKY